MNSRKKVAIYIDGSNFYFSIKKRFNIKIDIEKFCQKIVNNDELIKINYYISSVTQSSHPNQYTTQQKFFESLNKVDKLKLVTGRLEKRKYEGNIFYVEKANDVNLALDLVLDAEKNIYDRAYLISNDGDFSEVVKAAKGFGKEVVYVAIGNKGSISYHLKKISSLIFYITENFISDCKRV